MSQHTPNKTWYSGAWARIGALHPTEKNKYVHIGVGVYNDQPQIALKLDEKDPLIQGRSGKGGDVFFGMLQATVPVNEFQMIANWLIEESGKSGDADELAVVIKKAVKPEGGYQSGGKTEYVEQAKIRVSRSAEGMMSISFEDLYTGNAQAIPNVRAIFAIADRRRATILGPNSTEPSKAELSRRYAKIFGQNMLNMVTSIANRWIPPEPRSGGGGGGGYQDRGGRPNNDRGGYQDRPSRPASRPVEQAKEMSDDGDPIYY